MVAIAMRFTAVLLVLVPLCSGTVTVEELQGEMKEMQQQMKQKDLQHEQQLARMNDIMSVLQVKSTTSHFRSISKSIVEVVFIIM